ncbi:protein of unknown function (plasmid) [Cupriavidus taiwanensis]|nr:hypothetical protein CBM2598_U30076 [Cupriavidus taiwanensis]SPD38067.1 protein of unknown function [Cupriavidus taiwanensis]
MLTPLGELASFNSPKSSQFWYGFPEIRYEHAQPYKHGLLRLRSLQQSDACASFLESSQKSPCF